MHASYIERKVVSFYVQGTTHSSRFGFERHTVMTLEDGSVVVRWLTNNAYDNLVKDGIIRFYEERK